MNRCSHGGFRMILLRSIKKKRSKETTFAETRPADNRLAACTWLTLFSSTLSIITVDRSQKTYPEELFCVSVTFKRLAGTLFHQVGPFSWLLIIRPDISSWVFVGSRRTNEPKSFKLWFCGYGGGGGVAGSHQAASRPYFPAGGERLLIKCEHFKKNFPLIRLASSRLQRRREETIEMRWDESKRDAQQPTLRLSSGCWCCNNHPFAVIMYPSLILCSNCGRQRSDDWISEFQITNPIAARGIFHPCHPSSHVPNRCPSEDSEYQRFSVSASRCSFLRSPRNSLCISVQL